MAEPSDLVRSDLRVRDEESILNQDPDYRNFASRMRTLLIPGVF